MTTKVAFLSTKSCLGIAAAAACVLLAGSVQADDAVTIKVTVNTAGLDLSGQAGISELYGRLGRAADTVCTHGNRVDLQPVANFAVCYQNALGAAVRSAHQPRLTLMYLAAHTLKDATTHGIEVPLLQAAAQPRE